MLMRICLIGAIVLSLAVAGINFFVVKDKITALGADRDKEKSIKEDTQTKLANTNKVLVAVNNDLTKTKGELATAQTERAAAQAKEAEQTKRADGLAATLKTTEEKLADTANKLAAWDGLGIPITTARTTLTSLNTMSNKVAVMEVEKGVMYSQVQKLQNKLELILGKLPDGPVLPDDLRGKVTAVDPKYNFVIVNVGSQQGAMEAGKLLISRNSALVGEAIITASIDTNWCVANIAPGTDLANIHEGDVVIAANIGK